ncbi:MAG: hypothetical protein V5A47_10900 [Bacteroidales bacterium]
MRKVYVSGQWISCVVVINLKGSGTPLYPEIQIREVIRNLTGAI